MKSRKVLAALLVMGILAVAGAALAVDGKPDNQNRPPKPCMFGQHAHRPDFPNMPNKPGIMPQNHGAFMNFCRQFADNFRNNFNQPFGGRHNRQHYQQFATFTPDMPDEIRTKTADIAKLRIDLDNVISKRPLDRAKANEIYTKITQLSGELKVWRFNRKLDRLEKLEKDKKNGKPERPDRAGRHGRGENPVKPDKPEKPEKPDKDDDDKHEKHDDD